MDVLRPPQFTVALGQWTEQWAKAWSRETGDGRGETADGLLAGEAGRSAGGNLLVGIVSLLHQRGPALTDGASPTTRCVCPSIQPVSLPVTVP